MTSRLPRRRWPSALLIRAVFDRDARRTRMEMERHDTADVSERLGVSYAESSRWGAGAADTTFDMFRPAGQSESALLPAVVWIHGGGWISGDRNNVRPYVRCIADAGFVAVSLNYSVAPEHPYPTALQQLDAALDHLIQHATAYRIDPERIVLAGDSAGANLASQLALLTTSPTYSDQVGLEPALHPGQLCGLVLNCGIYDVSGVADASGVGGWGFRVALRSYLGRRDWPDSPGADEMSTLMHLTADGPPIWVTGGNGDPLTASQSRPLAHALEQLGVDVTALFYEADHEPSLPHEYQFHLDLPDARAALVSTIDFLHRVTRTS